MTLHLSEMYEKEHLLLVPVLPLRWLRFLQARLRMVWCSGCGLFLRAGDRRVVVGVLLLGVSVGIVVALLVP